MSNSIPGEIKRKMELYENIKSDKYNNKQRYI